MIDLTGKITNKGWKILDRATFPADHTGGYFSDCYYVENNNKRAFLKVLDISKFTVRQLAGILAGFEYETGLLVRCREKSLNRVVQILDEGDIEIDPTAPPAFSTAPYIVFELANGDIRSTVDVSTTVSTQWRLRVLHQATLGLLQLHQEGIAHQDLKPSNVLRFPEEKLKIGDLGRSSLRGSAAPHDNIDIAGARNYAPFEQRYGYVPSDWIERRISTDLFHLGSLIVFVFTNICFPEHVIQKMPHAFWPGNWGDPYPTVVPHIQAAMMESIIEISKEFPSQIRDELSLCVKELCDPMPINRGKPNGKNKFAGTNLWAQPYASRFDRLEKSSRIRVAKQN